MSAQTSPVLGKIYLVHVTGYGVDYRVAVVAQCRAHAHTAVRDHHRIREQFAGIARPLPVKVRVRCRPLGDRAVPEGVRTLNAIS